MAVMEEFCRIAKKLPKNVDVQCVSSAPGMSSNLLEKCMDKLVEVNTRLTTATLDQNNMNREFIVTRNLPNINIPVFSGDPLQYPIWKNSFETFIDSKRMDPKIKLNFLSQYVTGKPKHFVEHFLLIGTEDANQAGKVLLHERYGNSNVVSSTSISKLEEWPNIVVKNADALRDLC